MRGGELLSTILLVPSVLFTSVPTSSGTTLQCYRCTAIRQPQYTNSTERLCSNFDYSATYIVDCPYSTLCMKRIHSVNFPAGMVNITERDCAHQKYMTQVYENGKWQQKIVVEEPYTEGCEDIDNRGRKTSMNHHCYCRGHLCNGATSDNSSQRNTIISGNSMEFFVIAVIISIVNRNGQLADNT